MKFNRETLISTIETRISELVTEAEQAHAEAKVAYEKRKQEWLESEHPRYFGDEAEKLAAKARGGEVITSDTLSPFDHGWRDEAKEHLFTGEEPSYREPNTEALSNLRDFLQSVTDEEVSSSGLRDVGFRDIARILRRAAV